MKKNYTHFALLLCALLMTNVLSANNCSLTTKDIYSFPIGSVFQYKTLRTYYKNNDKIDTSITKYKVVDKWWQGDTLFYSRKGVEKHIIHENGDVIFEGFIAINDTVVIDTTTHVTNDCDGSFQKNKTYLLNPREFYAKVSINDTSKVVGEFLYFSTSPDEYSLITEDENQMNFKHFEEYIEGLGLTKGIYGDDWERWTTVLQGYEIGDEKVGVIDESLDINYGDNTGTCSPTLRDIYNFPVGSSFQYISKDISESGFGMREILRYVVTDMNWDNDTLYITKKGIIEAIHTHEQRSELMHYETYPFSQVERIVDYKHHPLNTCNGELAVIKKSQRDLFLETVIREDGTKVLGKNGRVFTYNDKGFFITIVDEDNFNEYNNIYENILEYQPKRGLVKNIERHVYTFYYKKYLSGSIINGDTIGTVDLHYNPIDEKECGPSFKEVYDFEEGAEFQYRKINRDKGKEYDSIVVEKYRVEDFNSTDISISYLKKGTRVSFLRNKDSQLEYQFDTIPFTEKITHTDSTNHFLNKCDGEMALLNGMKEIQSQVIVNGDEKTFGGKGNVYIDYEGFLLRLSDALLESTGIGSKCGINSPNDGTYKKSVGLLHRKVETDCSGEEIICEAYTLNGDTVGVFDEGLQLPVKTCKPTLREIYDFSIGDVFETEYEFGGEGDPEPAVYNFTYSVTYYKWDNDTLVYTVEGKKSTKQFDHGSNTLQTKTTEYSETFTIIDSINHPLNACEDAELFHDDLSLSVIIEDGTKTIFGERKCTDEQLNDQSCIDDGKKYEAQYKEGMGMVYLFDGDYMNYDEHKLISFTASEDRVGIIKPETEKEDMIIVYPQVVTNETVITIQSDLNIHTVLMYSSQGKLITEKQCVNNTFVIGNVTAGIYFLECTAADAQFRAKILKL